MERSLRFVLNRPTPQPQPVTRKRHRRRTALPVEPTAEQVVIIKKKLYAGWYVARLVRLGRLPKARGLVCGLCLEKKADHWHHEDYDRPGSVVALCHACHGQANATRREWEREDTE